MLYREIIAVCSEIRSNHINTLCGQNVEFVNVKPGGTYSNQWALEAQIRGMSATTRSGFHTRLIDTLILFILCNEICFSLQNQQSAHAAHINNNTFFLLHVSAVDCHLQELTSIFKTR
jgi:hypothetical protein